jgi:hypothetical protein
MDPQRTDFLPPEVYTDHAKWTEAHPAAHPAAFPQRLPPLIVPFDSSFDIFGANVAFAIRHYVIYRTDGGMFARGLVREKLQAIHSYLLHKAHMANGSKVRLEAILWRRKDPIAIRRWSLAIEFAIPKTTTNVDNDVIEVPRAVIAKAEKDLAATVLHTAGLVAQNIDRQNHNQGDRIIKMVQIADRLGYPRFLDLWYYGPLHVEVYLNLDPGPHFRERMTAQTGGRFPFDGWPMQGEGQSWSAHEWREFPFRSMLKLCSRSQDDPDACHAAINNVLLIADRDIMTSIAKANQAYQIANATDSRAWGPLWAAFYNHFQETQTSADHLLSAYRQKSRASGAASWAFGAQ